jgi:hypothetical protein
MKQSNGKKTMTIFCHMSGFEADYTKKPPPHCPNSKRHKLSLEKDPSWDALSEMWAAANGHISARCSLPQWFFQMDKKVEWEEFKAMISNHEAIGPPPSGNSEEAMGFWKEKTGLRALLVKGIESTCTILSGLGISGEGGAEEFLRRDPKVTALMASYLHYWKKKG